ncbi:MAG: hypothetical protein ACU841_03260 [Gammaproteobacteria bacterium]
MKRFVSLTGSEAIGYDPVQDVDVLRKEPLLRRWIAPVRTE